MAFAVPLVGGLLSTVAVVVAVLWLLDETLSLLAGCVPRRARRLVHPSPEPREVPDNVLPLFGPRA